MEPQQVEWPALPLAEWRDTYRTLHLYTQMVGKVRLALTPMMNQWWNVALYLTTRGLTTSPMPYRDLTLELELDFIEHVLRASLCDGRSNAIALGGSVRDFHQQLEGALEALAVDVRIWPVPVEIPMKTPFTEDTKHATYVRERARRCWEVLRRVESTFESYRAGYRGKSSPVHFFWGGFDLAVTRFSGRLAPPKMDGTFIDCLAYDEELASLGFWPGDVWNMFDGSDAFFYAYAYPAPAGYGSAGVRPDGAFFSETIGEYVLPYETVRKARDPRRAILDFAERVLGRGEPRGLGSPAARLPRARLA